MCCETMRPNGSPCSRKATQVLQHRNLCIQHFLAELRHLEYAPQEIAAWRA